MNDYMLHVDDVFCDSCPDGYPKSCVCGGLIHLDGNERCGRCGDENRKKGTMVEERPVSDYVIVRRRSLPGMSTGQYGSPVDLPENSVRAQDTRAKVIRVGPGYCDEYGNMWAMSAKVGSEVRLSQYAGTDYKKTHEDGTVEVFTIVREGQIMVQDGQPLHDRILIIRDTPPKCTSAGLFIPETAEREKPMMATVVAVGPGRRLRDGTLMDVQVDPGDRVLVGRHAGEHFTDDGDGETYSLIGENEVMLNCGNESESVALESGDLPADESSAVSA